MCVCNSWGVKTNDLIFIFYIFPKNVKKKLLVTYNLIKNYSKNKNQPLFILVLQ